MDTKIRDAGVPAATLDSVVNNPEDITIIANADHMVVAAGPQGLIVVKLPEGEIIQSLPEITEAIAVAYDSYAKEIVASVANPDDSYELRIFSISQTPTLTHKSTIPIPNQPEVRVGYSRWVTIDPLTGAYLVGCGDSKQAVIWKYNHKEWSTVLEFAGHIEQPCILPRTSPDHYEIVAAVWTEKDLWHMKTFSFNNDRLCKEAIAHKTAKDLMNPSGVAVEPESGDMVFYDYQSGNLYKSSAPDYANITLGGIVKAGSSVAMAYSGAWVWCSSSEENLIRGFRDKS